MIVVIGVVAIINLPVSQYPNIVPPTVMVTTNYPGASPQTVIDTVALPIELQVNGVDNMLCMSSTSAADGSYQLIVTFKIGMDPDTAQVLVQNRVSNAIPSLPMSVQAQGVTVKKKSTAILQIVTLDSPGGTYDASFLSNYATINLVNDWRACREWPTSTSSAPRNMRCGSGWTPESSMPSASPRKKSSWRFASRVSSWPPARPACRRPPRPRISNIPSISNRASTIQVSSSRSSSVGRHGPGRAPRQDQGYWKS